jgi:hypothetical protein
MYESGTQVRHVYFPNDSIRISTLGELKSAGLIDYHCAHITVLDQPGLDARVCECYAEVKKEFNRLLPEVMVPKPACSGATYLFK